MVFRFNLSNERTRQLLSCATVSGSMTFDEFHSLLPGDDDSTDDIADAMMALNEMGIEVGDGLTPEQRLEKQNKDDLAFLESQRAWAAMGNFSSPTAEGWDRICRAIEMKKKQKGES